MMKKRDVFLEEVLLDLLNMFERPMTQAELAHWLKMPLDKVEVTVDALRYSGVIREVSMEDLLTEGK